MELTHNILWLLKQSFYFSYRFVNDAISSHGRVDRFRKSRP